MSEDFKCLKCGAHGKDVLGKDMLCGSCCRAYKKYHDPDKCEWCSRSYYDITPFGDGGVHKRVLKLGTPSSTYPKIGNRCKIQYIARLLTGEIFDTTREKLGDKLIGGTDDPFEGAIDRRQLPCPGIDLALKTMTKNELCDLVIREDYAFGKKGLEPKVLPGATVSYQVELISWKDMVIPQFPTEEEKRKYEQEKAEKERKEREENPPPSVEEQLRLSNEEKEQGNKFFKEGDYAKANEHYDHAFVNIFHTKEQWEYMFENNLKMELGRQKIILHQNRGISHLKLNNLKEARWDLSQCLKFDPDNQKALYNHAKLYMEYSKIEMNKEKAKEYWDIDRAYDLLKTAEDNIKRGKTLSNNSKAFIEIGNQAAAIHKQLDYYDRKYKEEQKKRFGNKLAEKINKRKEKLKKEDIDPEFEDMPPLEDYEGNADYLGPFNKPKEEGETEKPKEEEEEENGDAVNIMPPAPSTDVNENSNEQLPKE